MTLHSDVIGNAALRQSGRLGVPSPESHGSQLPELHTCACVTLNFLSFARQDLGTGRLQEAPDQQNLRQDSSSSPPLPSPSPPHPSHLDATTTPRAECQPAPLLVSSVGCLSA